MRWLHVTDTHLGVERHFVGAPRGFSRADDHVAALQAALAPALRGEVDAVVHSGDLFDRSRPNARAVAAAAAIFAEVGRQAPVLLVNGNHDWRGYGRLFPVPPPGVRIVDRPERVVVGGVALGLVPFRPKAAWWAADARVAVGGGVDALVAHQAFDGARVPGLTFRVGAQADTVGVAHVPRGVTRVWCGHIHPRQRLRVGDAEVVMPGSTERTSFSERDEGKGYAVWTFGARVEGRFVDLPTRPMVVVAGRADLAAIVPGALVRLATDDVAPGEIAARGGWWTGPARGVRPRNEAAPQLGLF